MARFLHEIPIRVRLFIESCGTAPKEVPRLAGVVVFSPGDLRTERVGFLPTTQFLAPLRIEGDEGKEEVFRSAVDPAGCWRRTCERDECPEEVEDDEVFLCSTVARPGNCTGRGDREGVPTTQKLLLWARLEETLPAIPKRVSEVKKRVRLTIIAALTS